MPRKNIVKTYVENGIYHIYNRGNDHKPIFHSEEDYLVFLELLQRYLLKPSRIYQRLKNYSDKIELLAFCLMENHFHFLLKQISNNVREISEFMQSILTSYSMIFNNRNNKVGHLWESNYKARLIENEFDLLGTSKYIHLNPSSDFKEANSYPYSSIRCYTSPNNENNLEFVNTKEIFRILPSPEAYIAFLKEKTIR